MNFFVFLLLTILSSSTEHHRPENNSNDHSYILTIESLSSESEHFTIEILSKDLGALKSTSTTEDTVTPFSKILGPGSHQIVVRHKEDKNEVIISKIQYVINGTKGGTCQSDNRVVHLTAGPDAYCRAY
ncbi:MAG: hypothetical protein ACI9FN_003040 [Saprospiraceae bacterium]|jgi:hypothetical protein